MAKKPAWLFNQSAVIPFILKQETLKIVIITSSSKKGWVIPKGVVERYMTPEDSAAKEALEEAGVIGNVLSEVISEYEYEKWGGTCKVKVYPLEVTQVMETWDEVNKRDRRILNIHEAIELVKPELKSSLVKFSQLIFKFKR